MCLAEALLRIPDKATRDADPRQDSGGNWSQHLGQSTSLFVNAASWGLLITGKLVATHNEAGMNSSPQGTHRQGVSRSSARASTWRCA
jgi:RHH-type proline utilization regulon transcriptional repressor/proline dehydrogenase/delta 1-pyrroline-5-carboxylate dehydrogenase